MKRFFLILVSAILLIYLALHVVLGSSPVQRWVLQQIRGTLTKYGISLEIESIEFSAFSPKLYLNRVKISTTPQAAIFLKDPLSIDKIKLSFQPLALIYRQIVIDEALLFHPQVFVPRAGRLYQKLSRLIQSRKQIELKGNDQLSLVIRKMGIVDALFDVSSVNPPFEVRSRSLTVILSLEATDQRTLEIQSPNLEFERKSLKLQLSKVDVDVDITQNSLRINKALVVGDDLSLDLKGISSLNMIPGKGPETVRGAFEVRLPLNLLTKIDELGIEDLGGSLITSGTVNISDGKYLGQGKVNYQGLGFDGYRLGSGEFNFLMDGKAVNFSGVRLGYADGTLSSENLKIDLVNRYPLTGDLKLSGVKFEEILSSVKSPGSPVKWTIDGGMKADGYLQGPLEIKCDIDSAVTNFVVLNDGDIPRSEDNTVINVGDGSLKGLITFTEEKLAFLANLGVLGGNVKADGFFSYENVAQVAFEGETVSLTQLGNIAGLRLGGNATLAGEVSVQGKDARVSGTVSIEEAEVSDIVFGKVSGQVVYQNQLLSFENLKIPSLEPILGNGFVDFSTEQTRYKFNVEVMRSPLDQMFAIFRKGELGFSPPTGGEVVDTRVSIEGGHDNKGVEVVGSGKTKNFDWYSEPWSSGDFIFTYRPDAIELNRIRLMKKTGGVGVRGHFDDRGSRLSFESYNLRVEEFAYIGEAPLSGRIEGELTLEGDKDSIMKSGYGEIRLLETRYRRSSLSPSVIRLRPASGGIEFLGSLMGQSARGRYLRNGKGEDELLLYLQQFDVVPTISLFLGKDVSTLTSLNVTGDLSLNGNLQDWKTLKGSGLVSQLNVGLRGTPLRNKSPVNVLLDKGNLRVSPFQLVGVDGEINGEVKFVANEDVNTILNGKVDLQYLQPFIPSLETGSGKVTISLRMSGKPNNFKLLGGVSLENGNLRLQGLSDEFKNTDLQMGISQDKLSITRLESSVNGGKLRISGYVGIDRFTKFSPNLSMVADKVEMQFAEALKTKLSGEFTLMGTKAPYMLKGSCRLLGGGLTALDLGDKNTLKDDSVPAFDFDVRCTADEGLAVDTDIIKAKFKGDFHVLGNSSQIGLLGNAEGLGGSIYFREKAFDIESAIVRFQSPNQIEPRFRVSGRTVVKEEGVQVPQEYVINLQAIGTPKDFRIRLSSTPPLSEGDITSLLLLGVTSQGQEGNYVQFGTTVLGQTPIQSKLQNELGVDIKIGTQSVEQQTSSTGTSDTSGGITVPTVQIQKKVTDKTKVTLSNTVGVAVPTSEIRIEQILDENLTVNATAGTGSKDGTDQTSNTFGLDFRFRFEFD